MILKKLALCDSEAWPSTCHLSPVITTRLSQHPLFKPMNYSPSAIAKQCCKQFAIQSPLTPIFLIF
ncbi:MAG: hypothetical protein ACKPE3_20270, partial [Sphaerospermopsis kisseleviana]